MRNSAQSAQCRALPGVALATAMAALAASGTVRADTLQISSGIWCDDARQVERVYRSHLVDGVALGIALAIANAKAPDRPACAAGQAIVAEAGEALRFVAGDKVMSVKQYAVFGVMTNGQPRRVKPKVSYGVRVVGKLTSL